VFGSSSPCAGFEVAKECCQKRSISVWCDGGGGRRQHIRGKYFRCPFQYPKVPLEASAPPPPNLLMLPTPLLVTT
jgi:hypothetical protein